MDASHQAYVFMYVQFAYVFPTLYYVLFHRHVFLAAEFPPGLWDLRFLKASLADKV